MTQAEITYIHKYKEKTLLKHFYGHFSLGAFFFLNPENAEKPVQLGTAFTDGSTGTRQQDNNAFLFNRQ